ncbi:MAG: hypothetical protein OFPI_31990 [Osedax symbiont Rs2]|nr:MAG: hypothetical protein OFPI_31990 [Osedax symbiont Rs2]
MNKKLKYLSVVILFGASLPIYCQGSFFITNYSPEDYKGFRQNWAVTQDSSGVMYFGNNEGLFWFDGIKWGNTHVSDKTILYSLLSSSDGDLYFGTEKSFGYMTSNRLNQRISINLNDKVPDSLKQRSIVRRIQENEGLVYFQSSDFIYVFDGSEVDIIQSDSKFGQLVKAGDRIFVRLIGKGLAEIKGKTLSHIEDSHFDTKELYTASKLGDKIVFGTRNNGLEVLINNRFEEYSGPLQKFLKDKWIYRSITLSNSEILFVTINHGLIIANIDNETYSTISKSDGLPSNQTYNAYLDSERNLWVTHDQGISKVSLYNPIKKKTSVNTSALEILDKEVFLGGTNGLYKISHDSISMISSDRVYSLDEIEENLIINSVNGLYRLDRSSSNLDLIDRKGAYFDLKGIKNLDHYEIYLTAENELVKKTYNSFWEKVNEKSIKTDGAGRNLEFFGDNLWITTSDNEILRIDQSSQVQQTYSLNIDKSTEIRTIVATNKGLFVGTDNGLYRYDEGLDQFIRKRIVLDNKNESKQIYRIQECGNGQFWFQYDRSIHKLDIDNDSVFHLKASPYQQIGEQEPINIIRCSEDVIHFGGANGLYTLPNQDWDYIKKFKTNVTRVFIRNDSLVYGGFHELKEPLIINYNENELRFTFAAASFIEPKRNLFSVRLEGFEESWSPWSLESQKDYTNIPEGTYTFMVKSKNVFDVEGAISTFSFTVLPPWYRTWWAYLIYTGFIIGILYLMYTIRVNQILKVHQVRNRIADDLHDDLSGTLIGISNFAKAINASTDIAKQNRFLGLIQKSADEAKEKISDIVWTINPEHDDWNNFLTKCRRYASDIFESQNIQYSLEMDQSIPGEMKMDVRKNLWLIFKEILTNITKHSEADYVLVRFKEVNKKLLILIKDNGKGFDIETIEKGNGIQSIAKRIHAINGEVELESNKEQGTFWNIQIRI